jgi:Flp pilus assembly protein TadG
LRRHRIHLATGNRGLRNPARKNEEGVIIILVAIFMLFVVGAMAALSIDVTTFYTARSEAQLAADGAALAAARVLANSGMTSSTDPDLATNAETLATNIAMQVAQTDQVGGGAATSVTVNFSQCSQTPLQNNPCVTVRVTRTDLPTFFARIWGSTQVTVSASATAEAYNPSGLATGISLSPANPVATTCVKPWVLPNMDPNNSGNPIFDRGSGAILDSALLGYSGSNLRALCDSGNPACPTPPQTWQYYQGDETSFPHPTQALPACAPATNFQESIAGCVQTPIACNSLVTIDTTTGTLDADAADAVDCLAHTSNNKGDAIDPTVQPPTPFTFEAGRDNPLVQAGTLSAGSRVIVSDSLVTVPVFDNSTWTASTTSVQVIGFVQLFLQPSGLKVAGNNQIATKVINLVGCGTNASGTPVYGNGPSAVAVRLVTAP